MIPIAPELLPSSMDQGESFPSTLKPLHHLRHRIELQQGYCSPKPQPKFGGKMQQPIVGAWQSTPHDPTEEFSAVVPSYQPRTVVSEVSTTVPGTVDLVMESQRRFQLFQWTMGHLHRLDLWGTEEDPYEATPELLALEQMEFRRQKGFRPASPSMLVPSYTNNVRL